MQRNETAQIVQILVETYPSQFKAESPVLLQVWEATMVDLDFADVKKALFQYIQTSTTGFPPVPGQLRALIAKPQTAKIMTASEAWGLVRNAIGNALYGAEEEFNALPKTIQRIVGTPQMLRDMAMLDQAGISVEQANFTRAYEGMARETKENLAIGIPSDILIAFPKQTEMLAGGGIG